MQTFGTRVLKTKGHQASNLLNCEGSVKASIRFGRAALLRWSSQEQCGRSCCAVYLSSPSSTEEDGKDEFDNVDCNVDNVTCPVGRLRIFVLHGMLAAPRSRRQVA